MRQIINFELANNNFDWIASSSQEPLVPTSTLWNWGTQYLRYILFIIIDITSRRGSSARMNYSKNFPARERERERMPPPSPSHLQGSSRRSFYTIPSVFVLYHIIRPTFLFALVVSCYAVVPVREKRYFTASYCIHDRTYDRFNLVARLAIIIISERRELLFLSANQRWPTSLNPVK